ncbi:MAG: response regulator transcription factor [Xenococcaceae cyanobacterium]
MIRILLADDQNFISRELYTYLEPAKDLEIVGSAKYDLTVIEQIELMHPDIVLVDIEMSSIDGLSTTRLVSQHFANSKVLILSNHANEEYIKEALQAGAKGYILKNTSAEELADAIRLVHKGYILVVPGLLEKLFTKAPTTKYVSNELTQLRDKFNYYLTELEQAFKLKDKVANSQIVHVKQELGAIEKNLHHELTIQIDRVKEEIHQHLMNFERDLLSQMEEELNTFIKSMGESGFLIELAEKHQWLESQLLRTKASLERFEKFVYRMFIYLVIPFSAGTIGLFFWISFH